MKIKIRHIIAIGAAVIGGTIYIQTKPTPVPPPSGGCTVLDTSGCMTYPHGTFVTFNNPTHVDTAQGLVNCTQNWASYAQAASAVGKHQDATVTNPTGLSVYPIHLVFNWSGSSRLNIPAGVNEGTGCVGQGPSATVPDVIIDMQGDGLNHGQAVDALHVQDGAGCPTGQILNDPTRTDTARLACPGIFQTGVLNDGPKDCGPDLVCGLQPCDNTAAPGSPAKVGCDDAHQDYIQIFGGENIFFNGFKLGDIALLKATAEADGGTFYINAEGPNGNAPGFTCNTLTSAGCKNWGWCVNCVADGILGVGCNKGLATHLESLNAAVNGQNSTGVVKNSTFWSGQRNTSAIPGNLPNCWTSTGAIDDSGLNYAAGLNNLKNDASGWTFGPNLAGSYWCNSTCGWSPGFGTPVLVA